jgi:hypothetical protein
MPQSIFAITKVSDAVQYLRTQLKVRKVVVPPKRHH